MFFRNDQQAVLFVAILLPFFPPDTQVSEIHEKEDATQNERKFMEAIENCFEIIINHDDFEETEKVSRSNKRKITSEQHLKTNWKTSLHEARWKLDQIYLKMNLQ